MAGGSMLLLYSFSRRRVLDSLRGGYYFFIPTALALTSSLFILFYISSTSNLFFIHIHPPPTTQIPFHPTQQQSLLATPTSPILQIPKNGPFIASNSSLPFHEIPLSKNDSVGSGVQNQSPLELQITSSNGNNVNNEVFHDRDIFMENYVEMNKSLKIYIYPHGRDDPFANVLLPVDFEPGGNYASESYFKRAIVKSHFITKEPSKADLFYLPFSIARLRHDPRVGIDGIQDFVRDYVFNISHNYPYWNRSGGADHFYVACHSIGRSALKKASEVKFNAIQVVCSSSYFVSSYVAHKDASLPQIWPRQGDFPPSLAVSERKKLAFFAGSINSPVREKLVQVWGNDSEISVHLGRLKTPYEEALMGSKFCLHVKGFEVNTARIGDALYYGCIPVIIANHYDLPFADVLNWRSFSIVVATLDIPLLKEVLGGVNYDEYVILQRNVLKVRKHFQWHVLPVDFDAFYMVMYELWLRRSSTVRIPF
ncbi:hypothetical protein LguiB_033311 [Lonicera macranthoides]